MITESKQLLTHSRMDAFKVCRRKHQFAYELRIRRTEDAKALRMGSAFHDALEVLANTNELAAACEVVRVRYDVMPENYEQLEWEYECETVVRLVCGYQWRWQNDNLDYLAAEREFRLPLINPETGKSTPTWDLAGKIDGIVRFDVSRYAVKESKLLSEDLADDSDLWRRLRIDHQISLYILAARRLGFETDCVLYDVTRKPTKKPEQVPICDGDGIEIVLDQNGDRVTTQKGTWRRTADKEKGYVLQTRPQTAEEWGEKLREDIARRPGFYFQRREITRLDVDLERFESEIWDIQRVMRDAQLNDRHYRTCNRDTCSWCYAFDLCSGGWQNTDPLPEGFIVVDNVNPELEHHENVPS